MHLELWQCGGHFAAVLFLFLVVALAVAVQFRGQDDSNAEKLATTYTNATGDWNTEDGR